MRNYSRLAHQNETKPANIRSQLSAFFPQFSLSTDGRISTIDFATRLAQRQRNSAKRSKVHRLSDAFWGNAMSRSVTSAALARSVRGGAVWAGDFPRTIHNVATRSAIARRATRVHTYSGQRVYARPLASSLADKPLVESRSRMIIQIAIYLLVSRRPTSYFVYYG